MLLKKKIHGEDRKQYGQTGKSIGNPLKLLKNFRVGAKLGHGRVTQFFI